MNTFLNPEQEAAQQQYMEFAKQEVLPLVDKLEKHEICLKEFFQNLGQKGYLGISTPKEYGGQGLDFTRTILFIKAISNFEPGLALSLATHFAVIEVIKCYGNEQQKSRFLATLARGETIASLAFTEENAGTDMFAVQSKLTVSSSSAKTFQLTGKKTWVVSGEIANLFLVLSKSAEGNRDPLSLSLLSLGQENALKISESHKSFGLKSAYINNLEFESFSLSEDACISSDKDSTEMIAQFANDVSKLVLASAAVGLVESSINIAVEHARKREQFGVNIGQFQAVQWKLADMATENAGACLQVMRAAWALDHEISMFANYAAMSKLFASKVARIHSGEALQILGASGLDENSLLAKFYRDAKVMEISLGTSEAQKLQMVNTLRI